MRRTDQFELLVLAAVWGGSFLFMRLGALEFGPAALVFLRVAGASALLLPLLVWRGDAAALRRHWRPIAVVGLVNTALPFALYMVAALALSAGLMGIFNATAPLWAALIAWAWLGERPAPLRLVGLAVGFAGVLALGVHKAGWQPGLHGVSPALGVAASIAATACYGLGANLTKHHLAGVPPLATAAGSQLAATLLTLPAALWWWPARMPGASAWAGAAVLALVCTGLAYLMYFRLLAHAGPTNAISVTFLIPVFAMLWGALFLAEQVTPALLAGAAGILAGTALTTGVLGRARNASA